MNKFTALFTGSYAELKNIRTIVTAAMFAAISVVLGYFTVSVGDYIKIGFSSISNQCIYYMFGPVVGGIFGGALDILKYIIKPTGAFFPGFTLNAVLAGIIYGCILYKKKISLMRVFAAEFAVSIFINIILNTLWLSILYGKGFMLLLPARAFKNLIMWPVNSMLFFTVVKSLEKAGVFKKILL